MGMIDEYFAYQNDMESKYGLNTIVLMQVGSFFEVYGYDDIGKAKEISKICNMVLSSKNKNLPNSKKNPNMCGAPVASVQRYIQTLISSKYTVVIIEQDVNDSQIRKVSNIYSPGTYIGETNSNTIACVYSDDDGASVCWINVISGTINVQEIYEKEIHEEIFRILHMSGSNETLICSKNEKIATDGCTHKIAYNTLYANITYQNEVLGRVYGDFNMLSPIESVDMEMYRLGTASLVILLSFCESHNKSLVERIQKPNVITNNKMVLHHNTLYQLQIINEKKGLFDVVNKTCTAMGHRLLRNTMMNPLNNVNQLQTCYDDVDRISGRCNMVTKRLKHIVDIDRIIRQIANKTAKVNDVKNLIQCLEHATHISSQLQDMSFAIEADMIDKHYIKMTSIIDMTQSDYVFIHGAYEDIDNMRSCIERLMKALNTICIAFSRLIGKNDDTIKLECVKDTFVISATPSRAEALQKIVGNTVIFYKENKSRVTISSNEINALIHKLIQATENFNERVIVVFNEYLDSLHCMRNDLQLISNFIARVDMLTSFAIVSKLYNYTKPVVVEHDTAFVVAKGLRHAIVERLDSDTLYTGNDVNMKETRAMLLYGVNGSGKSCYSKSIGLSIVLAQMGMYVPAISFEFSPYNRIFTRISSDDNIYKGLSSFFVEMKELKTILDCADNRSIVIGDEVCKGTEDRSAMSIVASTCIELESKGVTFIFATHIHGLVHLKDIKQTNIHIKHIGIERLPDKMFVFDRKLRDGQGDAEYGLEIANHILNNKRFAHIALNIRNEITKNPHVKQSKYNKEVLVALCNICESTDALETHHIIFQRHAHENVRNSKANLVVLCSKCHDKVHANKLIISGWAKTSKGKRLEYK